MHGKIHKLQSLECIPLRGGAKGNTRGFLVGVVRSKILNHQKRPTDSVPTRVARRAGLYDVIRRGILIYGW